MYYTNRTDGNRLNPVKPNAKYKKPDKAIKELSTAQLRSWIHKYERAIKQLEQELKKR